MTKTRQILTDYWAPIYEGAKTTHSKGWLLGNLFELHSLSGRRLSPDDLLRAYRSREETGSALFFIHVLGVIPWVHLERGAQDQLEILEAYHESERYAVRSGHKTGKSNSIAGLALAHFACHYMARVPITSSSFQQVQLIIWHEIKNLYRNAFSSGRSIGGELHEDPHKGLTLPDGRQIFGFSTKEPERAAGISGPNISYKIDEASGVPEPVFQAIEGNRAGGAKIGLFGNPTRNSGTFYDAFHSKRSFYRRVHIPSRHSPNVQAGRIVVPGLATTAWIEEKRREWGETSPIYAVRVEGEFPVQSAYAVFSVDEVTQAQEYGRRLALLDPPPGPPFLIGVDPAGSGEDEAVALAVCGPRLWRRWGSYSTRGADVARAVLDLGAEIRRASRTDRTGPPIYARIDCTGLGWETHEALTGRYASRARELGLIAEPFVASQRAVENHKYYDRRTEAAFLAAQWIKDGGALLPHDEQLAHELIITEFQEVAGRWRLLPKTREKELLGHSPNTRDAFMIALYSGHGESAPLKVAGARESRAAAGSFISL